MPRQYCQTAAGETHTPCSLDTSRTAPSPTIRFSLPVREASKLCVECVQDLLRLRQKPRWCLGERKGVHQHREEHLTHMRLSMGFAYFMAGPGGCETAVNWWNFGFISDPFSLSTAPGTHKICKHESKRNK